MTNNNMVHHMLTTKERWESINEYIENLMKIKTKEELELEQITERLRKNAQNTQIYRIQIPKNI